MAVDAGRSGDHRNRGNRRRGADRMGAGAGASGGPDPALPPAPPTGSDRKTTAGGMRATLAMVVFAVTTMVAVSFVIPLGLTTTQIARERALTGAERQAASLIPVLTITDDPSVLTDAVASTSAGAARRLAVHLPGDAGSAGGSAGGSTSGTSSGSGSGSAGGSTIGTSHASAADVATARRNRRAYGVSTAAGWTLWRPVLQDQDRIAVIEVFVPQDQLSRGVAAAWLLLVCVALALAAVGVVMGNWLATRVVRSSRRLADAAASVGSGDLTVRLSPEGPRELQAAALAFNSMAEQVTNLLAAERETAADLSHRLRTPLTALRLSIDGMLTHPGDQRRLHRSRDALGRLEKEIDAVIAAARGSRSAGAGCDAAEVVRERMNFWSALAEDQQRQHELVVPEHPVPVPVTRTDLAAAVDTLLGNVFRHTSHGTAFTVTVHQGRQSVGLLFSDAGPGIDDVDAALRRGASGAGSTGLGLDIARRLAASTGGDLRVDRSPLGGTRVQLWMRTEP